MCFKSGNQLIFLILLSTLGQQLVQSHGCPRNPCAVKVSKGSMSPIYEGMELVTKVLELSVARSPACFVDVDDILSHFPFSGENKVFKIVLKCPQRHGVHVRRTGTEFLGNYVTYLQVEGCATSVEDMGQFSSAVDVRTLYYVRNATMTSHCDPKATCGNFTNVASLIFFNVQNPPPTFQKVFHCFTNSSLLSEVMARNFSWTEIPERVRTYFPNLQSLEVNMNKFEMPPLSFPWADNRMTLPRNLSRTAYFQDLYGKQLHINIPNNLFRRTLNLDNNNIKNLSAFAFHGFLEKVSLNGNNLQAVGEMTFQNVTGLQALELAHNALTTIPDRMLPDDNVLQYLDLSINLLQEISANTFRNLVNLRKLFLNHNDLKTLQRHAFSSLNSLEILNIANNKIASISIEALPIFSLHLSKLDFSNNPLITIPVNIFYLRKLEYVKLQYTDINFNALDEFLDLLDYRRLVESTTSKSSSPDFGLNSKGETVYSHELDLSNSNITHFELTDITPERSKKLKLLLRHFKFTLTGNKILCDCTIVPLVRFIQNQVNEAYLTGSEYMFQDWMCMSPSEFAGRHLLALKEKETYCKVGLSNCPSVCECFERYNATMRIIVDCRNRNLTLLPATVPVGGYVELWLNSNSISTLDNREYLPRLSSLDVSNNGLKNIDKDFFKFLLNVTELHLQSNLIGVLPEEIKDLRNTTIFIDKNQFQCNCRALWMKHWLLNTTNVRDRDLVTCLDGKDNVHTIVTANDSLFVCEEMTNVYQQQDFAVLSATLGLVLILTVITTILIYTFRFEIKVLMFIYFGIHPFDKDVSDDEEDIDVLVVHTSISTSWVTSNVMEPLINSNYTVFCPSDFILGFSVQDNLSALAKRARRMVIVLSSDMTLGDHLFSIAWDIGFQRMKETKLNFVKFVNCGMDVTDITDNDLRKFLKTKSCIYSGQKLFHKRLLYAVANKSGIYAKPKPKPSFDIVTNGQIGLLAHKEFDAFLSYNDELLCFVLNDIIPRLEHTGLKLCIPDRDFIVGSSVEENILCAIKHSHRTILLLSNAHVRNEWSLFIFRAAYEKYLALKHNHLLVLTTDDLDIDLVDEEIRHYLIRHICLSLSDPNLWMKLNNALPKVINVEL